MSMVVHKGGVIDSELNMGEVVARFGSQMGPLTYRVTSWGLIEVDWTLTGQDDGSSLPTATKRRVGLDKTTIMTWSSPEAAAKWGQPDTELNIEPATRYDFKGGPFSVARLVNEVQSQLSLYFSGQRQSFDLPIVLSGTGFQLAVWRYLLSIPYGCTRSYGDVAQAIDRAQAVRAVGQANRANPIAIVVPCHRVLGRGGHLVGYAGANIHLKEGLLAVEQGSPLYQ